METVNLKPAEISSFQKRVWQSLGSEGLRTFPWRDTFDPYEILVSEVMLQQTQTQRVLPKYNEFLKRFPNFTILAEAELREVLHAWSGLGYNRRAKALLACAQAVCEQWQGSLPSDTKQLMSLPGIGTYTSAAIRVFAFQKIDILVETNVRTVFFNHFFVDRDSVSDKELSHLVRATLPTVDVHSPDWRIREWYYALMDYGVVLKASGKGFNSKRVGYRRQSKFKGSKREVRGKIVATLVASKKGLLAEDLGCVCEISCSDSLYSVLSEMEAEQFLVRAPSGEYCIR